MPGIDDTLLLDARGLICPLPVLKARKVMKGLAAGDLLRVLAPDPGAPKDFEHFCATTGVILVGLEPRDDHVEITLRQPG